MIYIYIYFLGFFGGCCIIACVTVLCVGLLSHFTMDCHCGIATVYRSQCCFTNKYIHICYSCVVKLDERYELNILISIKLPHVCLLCTVVGCRMIICGTMWVDRRTHQRRSCV